MRGDVDETGFGEGLVPLHPTAEVADSVNSALRCREHEHVGPATLDERLELGNEASGECDIAA
jgi:hypothetical protein